MNDIQKRFLLFIIGCIGVRTLLIVISKNISVNYLPILGYLAIIPVIGFMYFYLTGTRTTGLEVVGGKIWWNDLRPIHSILYALFAYNAINKNEDSWKYLLADLIIGIGGFVNYHYSVGNFSKLL